MYPLCLLLCTCCNALSGHFRPYYPVQREEREDCLLQSHLFQPIRLYCTITAYNIISPMYRSCVYMDILVSVFTCLDMAYFRQYMCNLLVFPAHNVPVPGLIYWTVCFCVVSYWHSLRTHSGGGPAQGLSSCATGMYGNIMDLISLWVSSGNHPIILAYIV